MPKWTVCPTASRADTRPNTRSMAQCNGDDAWDDQAESENHTHIDRLLAKNGSPEKQ